MKQACEYIDRLHLLKDGEFPNGDEEQLMAHFRECDLCQAEWATLDRLTRMMATIDDVSPRPGFDKAFWDTVEAYEKNTFTHVLTRFFPQPLRRVMVPAAAALVLCAGLYAGLNAMKPYSDELTLVDQIELLEDYEVVDNLDLLENWDVINRMKEKT